MVYTWVGREWVEYQLAHDHRWPLTVDGERCLSGLFVFRTEADLDDFLAAGLRGSTEDEADFVRCAVDADWDQDTLLLAPEPEGVPRRRLAVRTGIHLL